MFVPRHMYVTQAVLSKFGPTVGCVKCDAVTNGRSEPRPHSVACRERMMGTLKEDPHMKQIEMQQEERMINILTRELDRADEMARNNARVDTQPRGSIIEQTS